MAEAAAANYALPPGLTVAMINLSENATYKVEAPDGRRWALRIHRDGYHSKTAIASELAWLIDLRDSGVVVTPKPVKGRDGEIIQMVGHCAAAAPAPRGAVGMGDGRRTRHRRGSVGALRGSGRSHRAHAPSRPPMAEAAVVHALHLGF